MTSSIGNAVSPSNVHVPTTQVALQLACEAARSACVRDCGHRDVGGVQRPGGNAERARRTPSGVELHGLSIALSWSRLRAERPENSVLRAKRDLQFCIPVRQRV